MTSSDNPSLVLATRNAGKVRELKSLLDDLEVELLDLRAYPDIPPTPEDADTYEENAMANAVAVAQRTGLAAMADDSGLEVDALGGAPGVRSARFAGEEATDADNVSLLH